MSRIATHALLRRTRHGELTIRDGATAHRFGRPAADDLTASVEVRSAHAYRAVLSGTTGLGRSYAAGAWDSEDLVALTRIGARHVAELDRLRVRWLAPVRPIERAVWRARGNTRRRSARRIAEHYDVGNDFFAAWLDETLTYSCALFEHPGQALADASRAKLDRALDRLALTPDSRLLEVGGGWGSLALRAAERHGCQVTTTTISRAQHEVATRRAAERGAQDRVQVESWDYRDLHGEYDALASIEMIEAVGWDRLNRFFEACEQRLRPGGRMVLQAIITPDHIHQAEKASRSFIGEVFPGGVLPSLAAILDAVRARTDFRVTGLDDLTPNYPLTLARWREGLDAAWDALRHRGYQERQLRLWRFYLAYCEAGFAERRIGVVQLALERPRAQAPGPAAIVPAPTLMPVPRGGVVAVPLGTGDPSCALATLARRDDARVVRITRAGEELRVLLAGTAFRDEQTLLGGGHR